MLKLVLVACFLVLVAGGRSSRLCPCVGCEANPVVDNRTWKAHAAQIANGTRHRAAGIGRAPAVAVPAPPQPAAADEEIEDEGVPTTIERAFSMEMAELVANGTVRVSGMEAVLKAAHCRYEGHLPEEVHLPPSWYMAKKEAISGLEPKWFTRDFCPECDHLFALDTADTECPRCEEDTRFDAAGKAPRQA